MIIHIYRDDPSQGKYDLLEWDDDTIRTDDKAFSLFQQAVSQALQDYRASIQHEASIRMHRLSRVATKADYLKEAKNAD